MMMVMAMTVMIQEMVMAVTVMMLEVIWKW